MVKKGIGFIDSGVGGLTVVKEAMKQLPNESFYYFGDTARCPYGPRPTEQVQKFTKQIAKYLLNLDIKLLVIACNTATAAVLDDLKKMLEIPVVGVIQPGARAAIKVSSNNQIGIIGTEGTIKSKAYNEALHSKKAEAEIYSLACPKFVPVVESNEFTSSIAKKIVNETLTPYQKTSIDTLIMGCTHYPLLKPIIQNAVGDDVTLIDSGAETVNEVSVLLDYYNIAATSYDQTKPSRQFFTTGSSSHFKQIAKEWLELENLYVKSIDVEEIEAYYG